MACRKLTVTQTTHMGQSNGTNLKPISPILFFNKLMKIGKYQYSVWTAGVRGCGVLVCRTEGKCYISTIRVKSSQIYNTVLSKREALPEIVQNVPLPLYNQTQHVKRHSYCEQMLEQNWLHNHSSTKHTYPSTCNTIYIANCCSLLFHSSLTLLYEHQCHATRLQCLHLSHPNMSMTGKENRRQPIRKWHHMWINNMQHTV